MSRRPPRLAIVPREVFDEIPAMLIGAHAAAAYAPARQTDDIDFIVEHARFAEAEAKLIASGWKKTTSLGFPGTSLGLYGSAWQHENGMDLDIMSSPQAWCQEAFDASVSRDPNGARVLPLPYLILMKLDSARGVDQGDLTRILGRLNDAEVERVVALVERHYTDRQVAEDIRQYATIGRWEWETGRDRPGT